MGFGYKMEEGEMTAYSIAKCVVEREAGPHIHTYIPVRYF